MSLSQALNQFAQNLGRYQRFAAVSAQNVKNVQFDYTNMPTYNTITK